MIFNQKAIQLLFESLTETDSRLKIVRAEQWDTIEPDTDAETFLKFDGKRWGRDLELYVSVIDLIGPRGVAATLLEEIIIPLKEPAPVAYVKGIEILREYDIGEDQNAWRELLDSLDHIELDDYFYPVDERRLADLSTKTKDAK
ncbi:MAG: hypothetical protein ACYDHW_16290 [Syntrophorhabdaceae bacterium]